MAAVAQQYHEEALEAQGENMEVSFVRRGRGNGGGGVGGGGVERVVVVAVGVRVSMIGVSLSLFSTANARSLGGRGV